jgi:large subunit ribosomal protein L17
MIELVDFNEIYGKGAKEAKTPAKRTRRAGTAKKKTETGDANASEANTAEQTAE